MKGGFYGLRAKQLSLFLVAVVCTTILIFGWAKAPILSSLVPPQSPVLQLPPDEELKVSEGISGSGSQSESADLEALVHSTDSSSSVSGNDSKSSMPVRGISQETIMKATNDSGVQHVSEGENSSKEQKQVSEGLSGSEDPSEGVDLVALVHSANTSSFANGNEMKNSVSVPGISQETTMKATEDSGLEQVSKGENSSKDAVDLVEPVSSTSTNVSLTGTENNNLKTPAEKQACNYAKGKWITDDNRPLYSGFGCKQWLSSMWACRLTQRTDFAYEKLRWQPKDCAMEDFTRSKFLKRMQNKTLAFIGDSLGRQQFQSLMCMVTGGEESPEVLDVGKEYGLIKARGHVRPDGWAYRFPSTNTTILYYWSASLSDLEPLNITNPATEYAMHLDRPPAFLRHFLPKFNVLVLNTGHHWNRGKLRANKWVMHVGGKPNTDRKIANIEGAKNFTIYSIVNWVNSELPKYPDLKAFYRSISPRHFFNGDWNTGGTCDNPSPRLGELEVLQDESFDPVAAGSVKGKRVKLLDITALSQLRDEGHISRYSIKATPGVQDCLHWCLPGVPDTWNELLFAQI